MPSFASQPFRSFKLGFLVNDSQSCRQTTSLFQSVPNSTSGLASQDQQPALSKQFIPVVVLAAFLLILLASHVFHYPRSLYTIPKPHTSRHEVIQTETHPAQQFWPTGSQTVGEATLARSTTFLRISLRRSTDSKLPYPRNMYRESAYLEPTVRLVQAYHNRSPEPRVYLPEEIIIPAYSPTLVNSPTSDYPISHLEFRGPPPRVYLPPTLPGTLELHFNDQADSFYPLQTAQDTSSLCMAAHPNSQYPPGLSPSPPAPMSTELYSLANMSPDIPISPLTPCPSLEYSGHLMTDESGRDATYIPLSPELSPPPLAHAHPVLVKRALSPWRRRSPAMMPDDIIPAAISDGMRGTTYRHRPSVPSRLRYFITRSASASMSGSQTHSTPESSLGKRSDKSAKTNKQSPKCDPSALDEPDSSRADVDAGAGISAGCPGAYMHARAFLDTAAILDASLERRGKDTQHRSREVPAPSYGQSNTVHDWPSDSAQEYTQLESHVMSRAEVEDMDMEEDVLDLREERHLSTLPSRRAQGTSPDYRALFGLGLRTVSEPLPTGRSRIVPVRSTSTSALSFDTMAAVSQHRESTSSVHRSERNLPNSSLRTVLSRWMNLRFEGAQTIPEEEKGRNEIMESVQDESIEVMVMGRWEGLDGT